MIKPLSEMTDEEIFTKIKELRTLRVAAFVAKTTTKKKKLEDTASKNSSKDLWDSVFGQIMGEEK